MFAKFAFPYWPRSFDGFLVELSPNFHVVSFPAPRFELLNFFPVNNMEKMLKERKGPNDRKLRQISVSYTTSHFLPKFYHPYINWCIYENTVFVLNTQYMTNSTLVCPVKIEYVTKNNIFGLKMMVKSGLGKIFLKFLHAHTMSFLLLNLYFWSKLLFSMR